MYSILDGLNNAQKAAVTSEADVLQILAPPGSGKTKTLTSRVAYLLQHRKYRPWNIICLTFTIKSSREMKDRISKLLCNEIESRIVLGTFHSVCRRYLVTYGRLIGLRKGFGIADTSDTISIIRRIIKRHKLNVDPKKAQARISHAKSMGLSHADLVQEQVKRKNVEQQEFMTVFEEYETQLAVSNLLDYDDLLLRCVDLLKSHPSCVSNVEAVLIDEFQDTNGVQFDLMRLFASKHNRITTVGDPDQSIYGWRSAQVENLRKMQRQYPDTLVIHLEDNYRSSGAILLAAQEVIEQDQSRPQKPLLPNHCPGTMPALRRLPSAETEAAWVTFEIQRIMSLTGNILSYCDFAILLRSASLSRLIETSMGRAGIPYRVVGGHRFYDRAEIKILLGYLRVVSEPDNNDAVSHIINVPARGIGEMTAKAMLEEAEGKRISLWQLVRNILQGCTKTHLKIAKAAENGLGTFSSLIINCRNRLLDPINPTSPHELLGYLIKKLDFKFFLEKHHAEDHESRWANVEELVAQASDYHIKGRGESEVNDPLPPDSEDALPIIEGLDQGKANRAEEALSRLLANIALATEMQRKDDDVGGQKQQPQATITTMHSAKGLEWPVVFIPSAYDGCIPHSRAEDTDEERRLLYVAMTRAQTLLYVSCPTKNSQREEATLSPFLSDRKVQHHLSNKGPAIDTGVVVDIAQILRRSCPSDGEMIRARRTFQHLEDNLWPLDGIEGAQAAQSRGSKWDLQNLNGITESQPKRRKVANDNSTKPLNLYTSSNIGISTTMESASAFTCNGNLGFTTASKHLNNTSASDRHENPKKVNKPSKGIVEGKVSDQCSLSNIWGVATESTKTQGKLQSVRPRVKAIQRFLKASQGMHEHEADMKQISNDRIRLSSIPQSLTSHRFEPSFISSRSPRTLEEHASSPNSYVFLSSSPPPADDTPDPSHNEIENDTSEDLHTYLIPSERHEEAVPAKTFHTTSIAQVKANVPRKTLGVRRSMAGWNPGSKQGFNVPKMKHGHR